MPVLVHDGLNLSASCVNKTLCEFIAVQFIIRVKARTSRLFSLFFGYLDKKLKVLDYAIKTT